MPETSTRFKVLGVMEQQQFQILVLELLRDLKADMNRRFDEVDKRFDRIEYEISEIKITMKDEPVKLQEDYNSRDKVKIIFGWQWSMISLGIATVAAGITKLWT